MQKKQVRNPGGDSFASIRELKASSQSAPLSAEKKFDPAERFRQLHPLSSRKHHSYVLPTPGETKGQVSSGPDTQSPRPRYASMSGPLEQIKREKILGNEKLQDVLYQVQRQYSERAIIIRIRLSFPLPWLRRSQQRSMINLLSLMLKNKRYAFSGPLTGKSWPNSYGLSEPIASTGPPMLFSRPILRTPMPPTVSSSPKLSPNASPTFVSSPKISELMSFLDPLIKLPSLLRTFAYAWILRPLGV